MDAVWETGMDSPLRGNDVRGMQGQEYRAFDLLGAYPARTRNLRGGAGLYWVGRTWYYGAEASGGMAARCEICGGGAEHE